MKTEQIKVNTNKMKVWYLESRNGEERWVLNELINIYICYYLQQQQNLMIKHFFNF